MKTKPLGQLISSLMASNLTAEIMHGLGSPFVVGLTYHGTTSDDKRGIDNMFGKHISYRVLKDHLTFIARHYRVVPLTQIVKTLANGGRLPRKAVFITFDDGYSGNYEVALPLLRELGLPATFFVPTYYVENRQPLLYDILDAAIKYTRKTRAKIPLAETPEILNLENEQIKYNAVTKVHGILKAMSFETQHEFLDEFVYELGFASADSVPLLGPHVVPVKWAQLREMSNAGMEIGSHTHRHIVLGRVAAELAEEELIVSKRLLDRNLEQSCSLFCYPNGHYPDDGNDFTNMLVKKTGYSCATYMDLGITTRATDPYFLTRYSLGLYSSMNALRSNLTGANPRIKSIFSRDRSAHHMYSKASDKANQSSLPSIG
jgi:peptidoglycan/xylan/chitin deacetylase (PgdA/CDA1 family)